MKENTMIEKIETCIARDLNENDIYAQDAELIKRVIDVLRSQNITISKAQSILIAAAKTLPFLQALS